MVSFSLGEELPSVTEYCLELILNNMPLFKVMLPREPGMGPGGGRTCAIMAENRQKVMVNASLLNPPLLSLWWFILTPTP